MLKSMGLWFLKERKMCNEDYSTIRDMRQSIQDHERHLKIWMDTAEKTSMEAFYANVEKDAYKKCIEEILKAIENEGAVPLYHRHVMRKHRSEWPTLWKAIDNSIKELKEYNGY